MLIQKIIVGENLNNIAMNCYLIIKNNKAVIIDPGDEAEEIINIITQQLK